jgi:hypothetical protein
VKRAALWVLDHWYLAVVLVLAIGLLILSRKNKKAAADMVATEMKAVEASAEARRLVAIRGAEQAREDVEAKYKAEREALDDEQKKQAAQLSGDPVALARFLVRAGGARSADL